MRNKDTNQETIGIQDKHKTKNSCTETVKKNHYISSITALTLSWHCWVQSSENVQLMASPLGEKDKTTMSVWSSGFLKGCLKDCFLSCLTQSIDEDLTYFESLGVTEDKGKVSSFLQRQKTWSTTDNFKTCHLKLLSKEQIGKKSIVKKT